LKTIPTTVLAKKFYYRRFWIQEAFLSTFLTHAIPLRVRKKKGFLSKRKNFSSFALTVPEDGCEYGSPALRYCGYSP
jgi:hypothetical protein